ncbi:MAG: sugar phosphate isomerase/epimerase [Phycisphaerae bacterium]|nr:sugar phosphate isomerase/epimerase [Phycisphaerae bacterium]
MVVGRNAGETVTGDPRPRLAVTLAPLVESATANSPGNAQDALGAIARMGYPAVQWSATSPGLRPRDLDASARRGIVSSMRRLELTCSGVDAWIPPGHLLDPATIDRAVGAIELAVRLAADLALGPSLSASDRLLRPHVSLLLPSETEFAERPAVASQAKDALDGLASLAARLGVVIADHALDAMQRTTRDGFGVGIDPALWVAAGRDPSAAATTAAGHLAAARLVDSFRSGMRGPILEPGESRLDVTAYRVALDLIGFRSPLVVDARQWRDPLAGVETTIRRWAERWGYELPSPGSSSLGSILHGDPRPRH